MCWHSYLTPVGRQPFRCRYGLVGSLFRTKDDSIDDGNEYLGS